MAHIRPFAGVRYAKTFGHDISNLIAPPYDILDEKGKAALQAKSPNNIVTVDLPHLPAKTVGPDATYAKANDTLQSWLSASILKRDPANTIYPYAQTYTHNGRTYHRRGLIALVRLSPFGQGQVVPHEKTYKDAIIDRLKLTTATSTQLSPIFGLFNDPRNEVTTTLYKNLGLPEQTATLDGVKNDLWRVTDSEAENKVIDFLGTKPIYIADGHHRYTMALQYQEDAKAANGGSLPPNHPANFCMFVLVSMKDDGLLILPTHRIIGNVESFDISAFRQAVAGNFDVTETPLGPDKLEEFTDHVLIKAPAHTFGLYDGRTQKIYQLALKNLDVLKPLEPKQSDAWRRLDVAILQRYLLEEVIQPKFAASKEITKAYTAYGNQVGPMTDGKVRQIALMLRPTPLHSLEELGKVNEVMPQKSTYFYPKLATGMVMNLLK